MFNPLVIFSPSTLFNAAAYSVAFSRAFTFEVVAGISTACGYNAPCHNLFHISLLTASGLLLAALLLRLLPRRPVLFIAGAVVFMLFSQPVMDALAWQATLLDKLSLFFCALGTYLVAQTDLHRSDQRYVIERNLVLLLVAIAAYNSKEATFPLLPSLVILLMLRFATLEPPSWASFAGALRRSFTLLAAPSLYALFHVAVVFINRTFLTPAENLRVTGGNAEFNFYHYFVYMFNLEPLSYFFNLYPYAPEPVLIQFAVAILVVTACLAFVVIKLASRSMILLWFWALISFIMAFVIPLRTTSIPPFYTLEPLFYLAILLCVTAVIAWDAARTSSAKMAVQGIVAILVILHVWGLGRPYAYYMHITEMSDNFAQAILQVKARIGRTSHPPGMLFLWPKTEPLAYMFLGSQGNRSLASYLLPPGTPSALLTSVDGAIRDESYVATPRRAAKPGELTVLLGKILKLQRIEGPPR